MLLYGRHFHVSFQMVGMLIRQSSSRARAQESMDGGMSEGWTPRGVVLVHSRRL